MTDKKAKSVNGFICIFVIALLAMPASSLGDAIDQSLGYRVTTGINVSATDFDVYNKGSTDTNGTLTEDFSYAPFIILGSPYKFLKDSRWGLLMEYNFSGFRLSKQFVTGENVNLGTSVNGYYAFVTPTLFYLFDNAVLADRRRSLIAGMGIGIGYLKATGNIKLTETTNQLFDIDVSGVATAISLFVDYRIGDFMTRLSGDLTTLSEGDFDYDSFAFNLGVSYVFEL